MTGSTCIFHFMSLTRSKLQVILNFVLSFSFRGKEIMTNFSIRTSICHLKFCTCVPTLTQGRTSIAKKRKEYINLEHAYITALYSFKIITKNILFTMKMSMAISKLQKSILQI